jgi:hypothetical protein
MGPHEATQLVPHWFARTPKIKASDVVLLYGRTFWQDGVKFPVVAEYCPTRCPDFRQPFVVWRGRQELELAMRVLMILDGKRRTGHPKQFRKALPTISIKEKS